MSFILMCLFLLIIYKIIYLNDRIILRWLERNHPIFYYDYFIMTRIK